jgi:hydrogenase maturation protease
VTRPTRGAPDRSAASDLRYVVLGLGNRIQGDEALGSLVVERLLSDAAILARLPDPASVDCLDGGTIGLGLLPLIEAVDGLVVVDLIDADRAPGTVLDLDGETLLRRDTVLGVHDLGATELLATLRFMDAMPRRTRVIGIQPKEISLGIELTPEVAGAVPGLIDGIVRHLTAWQREDGRGG